MTKKRLSATLSGAAGEYYVAAELSRRGFLASITPKNAQAVDVLASRLDGSRVVGIQVKTNQDRSKEWVLGKKDESLSRESLFYVFVNLNGPDGTPTFHIVPSAVVAKSCKENHQEWLAGRKRDGTPRKDTDMRAFRDQDGEYQGQWGRLGLGSSP